MSSSQLKHASVHNHHYFRQKINYRMDKELPKVPERFTVKAQKLGQGTFSYIYEAYDSQLRMNVALKMEKKDKSKNILKFEYQVLQHLKGLQHVPNSYEYVQNSEQNFIVMDLLGINLAKARRCLEQRYDLKIAIQILIEMVISVKEVHKRGFIHRDVKASNFVLDRENRKVYIVDFGLAKKHLDSENTPLPKRKNADFRGTVSFASLNAHNNIDLARRDDMWSLYFTMLDFLNEKLEWREQRDYTIVQVKDIKTKCLKSPKRKLWVGPTKGVKEVHEIFNHIQGLHYADMPDYQLVINNLLQIYNNYTMEQKPLTGGSTVWELKRRQVPHVQDRAARPIPDTNSRLECSMRLERSNDFQSYFNTHRSMQSQNIRIGKPELRIFETPIQQAPIFEIQPGHPHPGYLPPPLNNQDPQKLLGQQQMMQMMPGQQNMYDIRNKLPQPPQLQNNQIRPPNTMMLGPGNPGQQMYHKQPGEQNTDWMSPFLQPPNHLLGPQTGKPSSQQMIQLEQQQNPGIYGVNPVHDQNRGGMGLQGNPQQHQMQQQQPACNVQQFINIQISQQQQQQQAQQQQAQQKMMNSQQQDVNQYMQMKQYFPGMSEADRLNAQKMGLKQQINPGSQQHLQNKQMPPIPSRPSIQQPQLFQQSNGGGNGQIQVMHGDKQRYDEYAQQQMPGGEMGYQQNIQAMNNYHNELMEHLKRGGSIQSPTGGNLDKKRNLKRQAKGLGDIHGTGVQNDMKRVKYDNHMYPGQIAQMQGVNYSEKSPAIDMERQNMHNNIFEQPNQQQQMAMNQRSQNQNHQLMSQLRPPQQQIQQQIMPQQQQPGPINYQQNQQPKMFSGPIAQMPAHDFGDKLGIKQNENMMMKFSHGGAPEMYMQGKIGQMQPQQPFSQLLQHNQAGNGDYLNDIVPQQMRKISKRASMLGGGLGKGHSAPPDGFYCYYPEVFEKPNVQIFNITKVTRKKRPHLQLLENKQ